MRVLQAKNMKTLVGQIRATKQRKLVFTKPTLAKYENRKTIVSVMSGINKLGLIKTSTNREADRLLHASKLELTIGFNSARNEVVLVKPIY